MSGRHLLHLEKAIISPIPFIYLIKSWCVDSEENIFEKFGDSLEQARLNGENDSAKGNKVGFKWRRTQCENMKWRSDVTLNGMDNNDENHSKFKMDGMNNGINKKKWSWR